MTTIALMGAGGKMGVRLARNLAGSRFRVDHVEISPSGRARLAEELGVETVASEEAIARADVVILAVPDRAIGDVSRGIVDALRPGAMLYVLDAAAPHAGTMALRPDLAGFCAHPCHPPLFGEEVELEAQRDFFGGARARQGVVCALVQGTDTDYALGEEIARAIYAPVARVHRCTVEQIAILEPALSETIGATLALALREAMDKAIACGVPAEAARDFMLGHLNIELAIAFGAFPDGKFSDGALQAIAQARPLIFRPDWLERVFDPQAVKRSAEDICNPRPAA